jgi:hypothetical protein
MRARGQKPLATRERFALADRQDIYQSWYWHLCLNSHNNVGELERRHIAKSGSDFLIVPYKFNSPGELMMYFDGVTAILIDSAITIHNFLGTNVADDYKNRLDELNGLRATVQTHCGGT